MEVLVAHVENDEQMMSFGSTNVFDVDGGSTVAFVRSTSVIFGSTNEFEVSRSTIVSTGRTSMFNSLTGIRVWA